MEFTPIQIVSILVVVCSILLIGAGKVVSHWLTNVNTAVDLCDTFDSRFTTLEKHDKDFHQSRNEAQAAGVRIVLLESNLAAMKVEQSTAAASQNQAHYTTAAALAQLTTTLAKVELMVLELWERRKNDKGGVE